MFKYWLSTWLVSILFSQQLFSEESAAIDEIQSYLDFATYNDGIITLQQLREVEKQVLFIDSRSAEQFEQAHIPNAINIEWREILTRKDEVPQNRPVVLYCNTGSISSKAQFILRLSGFENAKVLHGGFDAWKATHKGN
jgi:rhodanese-related sulfurtransferase